MFSFTTEVPSVKILLCELLANKLFSTLVWAVSIPAVHEF